MPLPVAGFQHNPRVTLIDIKIVRLADIVRDASWPSPLSCQCDTELRILTGKAADCNWHCGCDKRGFRLIGRRVRAAQDRELLLHLTLWKDAGGRSGGFRLRSRRGCRELTVWEAAFCYMLLSKKRVRLNFISSAGCLWNPLLPEQTDDVPRDFPPITLKIGPMKLLFLPRKSGGIDSCSHLSDRFWSF
jgi:hypothetical protein